MIGLSFIHSWDSLFGLVVAHLQCGVIVNEGRLKVIHPDPVDATLLAVELDPVEVDDRGEDSQLHVTLGDEERARGELRAL